MHRFVVHLYVGSKFIGFLESWHKVKSSYTVCNNKHFARYFKSEDSCIYVMNSICSLYPYIHYSIVKVN